MGNFKTEVPLLRGDYLIVNSEIVQQAKEKLGNRNAELMAELLNLQNYDSRNMKAICPFHNEDTASFIYDPKAYRFHCFGCGITVDIIDVLMKIKHMSYIDACNQLFEWADISYSFGEHNVRTKANYRYPHAEGTDISDIHEYWNHRGISDETLEYLDVRSDGNGNTVFNYYDTNDVLTMVKYRPARSLKKGENKNWTQKGADTSPLLMNMNRINTSQPLLIVEGEADMMSAVEAGYYNTVSVPLGVQNTHWLEECWEWLDQFQEVIIAFDNDEAGTKARKDVIYRLGTWRCRVIDYPRFKESKNGNKIPIKDMNDCLQMFGASYVFNMIINSKEIPVSSVTDFSMIDDIDMNEMSGIETGIKPLDRELMKNFYGMLLILTGRPGSGKTSLVDQMIANAMDNDVPVFLFSKEMPDRMTASWMNFILAGARNVEEKTLDNGGTYYVVPYEIKKQIHEHYKKKLYIYNDSEPNDIDHVMASAEECTRKYGTKLIIIDNMMMLDLKSSEAEKNTAQTNLTNRLIDFATKFNVAVILIAHPKKTADINSDISMYEIAGTSNIINLAMRSLGLRRVSKSEKEDTKSKFHDYDVVLNIIKDRTCGRSDIDIGLHYDKKSRRFYTDYEEYDHQYKWDKNVYPNKIPYPPNERVGAFD